ncbi:MAG: molybdopterin-dependent oxidoreductase [Acidimicrobiaceae bacterium]|nr:molybdopterin-dependent oxidoreductase [Acidimicrobiaceae bacterium]
MIDDSRQPDTNESLSEDNEASAVDNSEHSDSNSMIKPEVDTSALASTKVSLSTQAYDNFAASPAWTRSLAGAAGAAVALGFGEFISEIIDGVPSLVVAVGELVVDYTPGDIIAVSIENLGSIQKTVLTTSIILLSLIIGGALGRFTTIQQRLPTVAGFAFFGIFGGWTAARNPISLDGWSWSVGALVGIVGILVTLFLISRADVVSQSKATSTDTESVDSQAEQKQEFTKDGKHPKDAIIGIPAQGKIDKLAHALSTRRSFLAWITSAGTTALAITAIGRRLSGRSAAEAARSQVGLSPRTNIPSDGNETLLNPEGSGVYKTISPDSTVLDQVDALNRFDEIDGLARYITPNSDFYRIDTAIITPKVDPDNWQLNITGMVDTPYTLTFDEILDMELSDYVITLSCVSNRVGGELVGNAVWTGVPLHVLLDRAGVQQGATQVVGRSVDDWTAGFPTEVVYDGRNAILAVGMNDEPLPILHGFPARLVVAGLYGYVSAVKWIEEINLTTWDGFDAYWVPKGWSKEGPMKTQSRIDVPRNGSSISIPSSATSIPIAGVAWAPTRGISKVEISINNGAWQECEIADALGKESWVQWSYQWNPGSSGDYQIQVRSTDGTGHTQNPGPVRPRPNGAEGWHTIDVQVTT